MTLTTSTKTVGALFVLDPAQHVQSKTNPVMTGNIELDSAKIELAAFFKVAQSGTEYLNLKLKLDKPVYGRLFRNLEKKTPNSPDYTGYLEINREQLRVSGWKVKPEGKRAYISLAINPISSTLHVDDGLPI